MRWLAIMLASLAVALALGGCGGGGGIAAISPFAGAWAGPWTDASAGQSGTANIVVGNNGQFSGNLYNSTFGLNGAVSGTMSTGGAVAGQYTYGDSVYTVSGTVAFQANGHLASVLREYLNGVLIGTLNADFTRQ